MAAADPDRFLTHAQCADLVRRATTLAHGGGSTWLGVDSRWRGYVRWGRNQVSSIGDTRNTTVELTRSINGAKATVAFNETNDVDLDAAVRRAERFLTLQDETADAKLRKPKNRPFPNPTIWSDATYRLSPDERVDVLKAVIQPIQEAGLVSAGFLMVGGVGSAHVEMDGADMYYPHTTAQYSITVRDADGTSSGWAGVDHHDWAKIDVQALTRVAVQKCLDSRNPVAVEPGRYTAILEPQAVCDFTSTLFGDTLDRMTAEQGSGPYASQRRGFSKIGQRIADRRIRVTADPMDPELGYVPFDIRTGEVYGAATWVEDGMLKNLSYNTDYAVKQLGKNDALLSNGAYRIHGGEATMDDMISSTDRGILVTRFSNLRTVSNDVPLVSGFTRDGLWLIEKGKISKAIKNFRFVESPLFALSNVVQIGAPVRVFHPSAPVVVPPLKVTDFNFVSLADAV
jgi:predicted Zn-dependent protease